MNLFIHIYNSLLWYNNKLAASISLLKYITFYYTLGQARNRLGREKKRTILKINSNVRSFITLISGLFYELYIWSCMKIFFLKNIFFLLFLTFQISHSVYRMSICNAHLSCISKVNLLSCLEGDRNMRLVQALSR